jgi:hypothetical protein
VDPDAAWSVYRDVDGDGHAVFMGVPWEEVLVHATEPAVGTAIAVVTLDAIGLTQHELVLSGGSQLLVRVADSGVPVAGTAVRLHPLARSIFIAERQTGADGLATWNRIQPGDYQVSIDHPGIWPTWHAFSYDGSAEPVEVPVMRLGGLRVQVRDAQGAPLPDLPITVHSQELGENVAGWIAGHRVISKPPTLHTDLQGQVLLEGLPRGPYRVTLTSPDGQSVEAMATVVARQTVALPLILE